MSSYQQLATTSDAQERRRQKNKLAQRKSRERRRQHTADHEGVNTCLDSTAQDQPDELHHIMYSHGHETLESQEREGIESKWLVPNIDAYFSMSGSSSTTPALLTPPASAIDAAWTGSDHALSQDASGSKSSLIQAGSISPFEFTGILPVGSETSQDVADYLSNLQPISDNMHQVVFASWT